MSPTIKINKKDVDKFIEWFAKLSFVVKNIQESDRAKKILVEISVEIGDSLITQGHCSADDLEHAMVLFIG